MSTVFFSNGDRTTDVGLGSDTYRTEVRNSYKYFSLTTLRSLPFWFLRDKQLVDATTERGEGDP